MDEALVVRGMDLYWAAVRALHEQGAPTWLEVELSLPQLRALFTLADYGATPIGGVAGRLRIGLPAASSLVDRLVEQGLASRREDPVDRRRTLAGLTAAGDLLVQRLRQGSREALRTWLSQVDPEDLRAFVRGLEALVMVSGYGRKEAVGADPRPLRRSSV